MLIPVSQSPRTKSSNIWGMEKMGVPAQEDREGICPSFALPFCAFGLPAIGWCCPRWWEWISSLSRMLNRTLISSRTPSQTYRETTFYQLFGHLLGQSSGHIKINHHRTPSIRIDANGWLFFLQPRTSVFSLSPNCCIIASLRNSGLHNSLY